MKNLKIDFPTLIKRAYDLRERYVKNNNLQAYRLFDGAADGLKDLYIDSFADNWLIQSRGDFHQDIVQAKGYKSLYFKTIDKINKSPPQRIVGEVLADYFTVKEDRASYWVSFDHGYSQGLFLDQRENRKELANLSQGKRLLNLFSYTCSFSVLAALYGAQTVNVDLSKPYLDWGQRNFLLNEITLKNHIFWCGDAREYLRKAKKAGDYFDTIVIDPPSFSRDKKTGVFQVEKDFLNLITAGLDVLRPNGILFFSTNLRKQSSDYFNNPIRELAHSRKKTCDTREMPSDFREEAYLKSFIIGA